jgi:hypothetical protein
MVGVRGEAVAEGAVAGADLLQEPLLNQEVQNAVDRDPVDILSATGQGENLLGAQRMGTAPDDLENPHTIEGTLQVPSLEEASIIAAIAHTHPSVLPGMSEALARKPADVETAEP